MEVSKRIIGEINGEDIYVIKFTNQNNYSLEFYNLGGYMHSILIPYKNIQTKNDHNNPCCLYKIKLWLFKMP